VKTLIRDRFTIAVVAGLIAIVGIVAFYYPIQLSDYDPWGIKIPCGTAMSPDVDQAVEADMYTANPPAGATSSGPTQYAAQCNQAVWIRRGWSVPLTLAGVIVVGVIALGRWPKSTSESESESRKAVSKD
jgi:H+/Cl- antiporter ClcA